MEQQRDFKGVWFPKEIYLNEDLSWTEKILLVEIDSLDRGNGCWASNEHLAKFLGRSESQIANLISRLRKENYIIDRQFDGRKRYISLNPGLRKTVKQGYGKPEGRVTENRNEIEEKISYDGSTQPSNDEVPIPSNTSSNTISNKYSKKGFLPLIKVPLYGEDANPRDTANPPFNYDSFLKGLKEGRKLDKIVALVWHRKGYQFTNLKQARSQYGKDIKFASQLAGYDGKQISQTMYVCEQDAKKLGYEWGLSTVAKKIASVINKK